MRPMLSFALAALSLVSAASCKRPAGSSGGPAQSFEQSGEKVSVTPAGVMVASDGSTVAIGLGSQLPADFPRAVPLYPGAKISVTSTAKDHGGHPTWTVILGTPDNVDSVAAFYARVLGAAASDMTVGTSRMIAWHAAAGTALEVSLMIAPSSEGETSVTLGVTSP